MGGEGIHTTTSFSYFSELRHFVGLNNRWSRRFVRLLELLFYLFFEIHFCTTLQWRTVLQSSQEMISNTCYRWQTLTPYLTSLASF